MMKRILLVDDKRAVCAVAKKMLSTKTFKAEVASTQAQAMGMLEQKDYDLCLIDIRAPGMSGMELYHQLKKEQPGLAVKIMLTEGDTSESSANRRFGKIRRPFLTRPFTAHQLRLVIEAASVQTDASLRNTIDSGKQSNSKAAITARCLISRKGV